MKSSQLEWSTCQIPRVVFTRVYYRILLYYHGLCIAIYILSIDTMQSEFGDSILKKGCQCLSVTNRAETMCAGLAMARRIWVDGFSADTMQEHEGSEKKKSTISIETTPFILWFCHII